MQVFEWCNLKQQYYRIWNCLLLFAESINILSHLPTNYETEARGFIFFKHYSEMIHRDLKFYIQPTETKTVVLVFSLDSPG